MLATEVGRLLTDQERGLRLAMFIASGPAPTASVRGWSGPLASAPPLPNASPSSPSCSHHHCVTTFSTYASTSRPPPGSSRALRVEPAVKCVSGGIVTRVAHQHRLQQRRTAPTGADDEKGPLASGQDTSRLRDEPRQVSSKVAMVARHRRADISEAAGSSEAPAAGPPLLFRYPYRHGSLQPPAPLYPTPRPSRKSAFTAIYHLDDWNAKTRLAKSSVSDPAPRSTPPSRARDLPRSSPTSVSRASSTHLRRLPLDPLRRPRRCPLHRRHRRAAHRGQPAALATDFTGVSDFTCTDLVGEPLAKVDLIIIAATVWSTSRRTCSKPSPTSALGQHLAAHHDLPRRHREPDLKTGGWRHQPTNRLQPARPGPADRRTPRERRTGIADRKLVDGPLENSSHVRTITEPPSRQSASRQSDERQSPSAASPSATCSAASPSAAPPAPQPAHPQPAQVREHMGPSHARRPARLREVDARQHQVWTSHDLRAATLSRRPAATITKVHASPSPENIAIVRDTQRPCRHAPRPARPRRQAGVLHRQPRARSALRTCPSEPSRAHQRLHRTRPPASSTGPSAGSMRPDQPGLVLRYGSSSSTPGQAPPRPPTTSPCDCPTPGSKRSPTDTGFAKATGRGRPGRQQGLQPQGHRRRLARSPHTPRRSKPSPQVAWSGWGTAGSSLGAATRVPWSEPDKGRAHHARC